MRPMNRTSSKSAGSRSATKSSLSTSPGTKPLGTPCERTFGLSRLPADRQREPGLPQFNGVDFQKQMIVAVFWGEMNFAGHDEKCWIESVGKAKDADGHDFIKVDCQANLWGGEILRSYTAYPYHVMVVPRSNLPVKFLQTVRYRADKARGEKDKILATLGPNAWKQELAEKLENANSQ